ncbi:MAG: RNase H-like domain-containing protein [Rhabdochlamydiaceae bacterium]
METETGPQNSAGITIRSDILQKTQLDLDSLVEKTIEQNEDSLLSSVPSGLVSSPAHAEGMVAMKNRIDGMEMRMESRLNRLESMLEDIMMAMVQQQKETPSKEVMDPLRRTVDGRISMQKDASVSGKVPETAVKESPERMENLPRVLAGVMPQESNTSTLDSDNRLYSAQSVHKLPTKDGLVGGVTGAKIEMPVNHLMTEQMHVVSQKPKMPVKFPEFRGKYGIYDAEEFLHRFIRVSRAAGLREQHYLDALLTCLTERDANWLEHWVFSTFEVSWAQISREFLDHFKSMNNKTEWLRKLQKMEMKSSIQEYTDEVLDLMHKLDWNTSSEEAIVQYKLGLPRWMLSQLSSFESHDLVMDGVENMPKMTVERLSKFALRIEANDKLKPFERHKDKQRNTSTFRNNDTSHGQTICNKCGKKGHTAKHCWKKEKREEFSKPSTEVPICNRCGIRGHTAEKCRVKLGNVRNDSNNKPKPTVKRLEVLKEDTLQDGSNNYNLDEEDESMLYVKRISNISEAVDVNDKVSTKYGIHTPCIIDGHRVTAFVDGGASTSFVSRQFAEKHNWKWSPVSGSIKSALVNNNTQRIGIVQNKRLENGKKIIIADFEVADLGDNEDFIIGLDLFPKLGYEINNVPFTWPQLMSSDKVKKEDVSTTCIHPDIDENGVAKQWKQVLQDNQALPVNSRCKLPGAELAINTDGSPVWIRQYPIPEGYKAAVDAKVKEWVENGTVIPAPVGCQWNSPLLGARKPGKDGKPDGVRVCFDGRQLNKRIVDNPDTNLPNLREIQDALGSFQWISVIDLAESYHQFPIKPQDREKTAFIWGEYGHLMFDGVPFGVKTMSAHMQRLMEQLLNPKNKKPFQDDVAITSNSIEEHIRDVKEVLDLITYTAGLRIRMEKCQFFKKEARVLGSIIGRDGIKMDPAKVKAICQWPRPIDGKGMQRFLGAANFHRDFSHHYARMTAHLEEVRNVVGPIEWTEERINAFDNVKKFFASDIMLRTIDWNKSLYLTTDASLYGIGAWIGQKNEFDDIVPVVCTSKKLNSTQQRWSATKRELYALMWSMQKLRHYLLGRFFIVRVDHKPLVHLFNGKMSPLLEGWIDNLLQFDFTTTYIPGVENELADALSRTFEPVMKGIRTVTDPEMQYAAAKRGKVIPTTSQRLSLIHKFHALGHFSIESMAKLLWNEGYWWPQMRNDIALEIKKCVECQRFNTIKEGYHPLKSIEAGQPWDHIQIDLIGPLPMSDNGFQWIMTVIDVMTGFTLLRALHTKEMTEVALSLWLIMSDFGSPRILQSDNGTEFVNELVNQLVQLFGIDRRLITPYHPRADGLVERKNKEVGRLLKKQMKGATDRWELLLPITQLSLNLKLLQRTGSKPFELFMARPFYMFEDWTEIKDGNATEFLQNRLKELKELRDVIWPAIKQRTTTHRAKTQTYHDGNNKIMQNLKPGTVVMALDTTRESKWDPVYEGPFTVVRQTNGGSYILKDATGDELSRRYAISMLKVVDVPSGGESEHVIEDDKQSFEVKEVLKHRQDKSGKSYEYLVRWKGYGSEDDSWIHESNFDDMAIIKKYWKKQSDVIKNKRKSGRGKSRK